MYACGFRIYFTPLPGFFSPFPHGTSSLSVDYEYLALEDGPPIFRQDFTCPALLVATLVPHSRFRIRGYHPLWPAFPDRFASSNAKNCKAPPISLATTFGISVDFCSSGYLDVSVHQVRPLEPMYSARCDPCLIDSPVALQPRLAWKGFCARIPRARKPIKQGSGFPIRISADQCSFASSPQLFAGCHVLHRL